MTNDQLLVDIDNIEWGLLETDIMNDEFWNTRQQTNNSMIEIKYMINYLVSLINQKILTAIYSKDLWFHFTLL